MAGSDSDQPDSRPNMFAGRYRLGDVLGRGGMAEVVSAVDDVLGRSVAVKIFHHSGTHDTSQRIDAEKRTLASLTHPGLVALYDAGEALDAGGVVVPYLVMELVDGPTLSTYRGNRALPPHVVARIGSELAAALTYIHSRGVVHRDIKPANILITRPGDPGSDHFTKLTDFGIARIVDGIRLTDHGTTVGTGHYMSPEQATGTSAGPATDIYSLGLVLIECLTGRMVFEGSAVAAAIARLHRDPVVPVDFGREWQAILTAMTARDPQDRPDAADLAQRLRSTGPAHPPAATATLDAGFIAASATTDRIAAAPAGRRRRWPAVAAAAVAAVAVTLAALIGWTVLGDDTAETTEPATVSTAPPTPEPQPVTTTPNAPATTVPAPPPVPIEPPTSVPDAPAPTAPPNPSADTGNGNSGNGNSGNGNSGNGNSGNGNSGNGNSGNPGNSGNGSNNGNNGNGRGNGG